MICKRKYLLRISLTILILNQVLIGYNQDRITIIKTQALDMVRSLLKKDFENFTRYMHPAVIKMAGGKEKIRQRMDTANAIAKQFGAEIKRILIGNPGKLVVYNKELQTTLPETTEMKTGFGNLTLQTTLIAISTDGGKHWYFIDTSVYNRNEIKKSLPNISPELVIPPLKPPTFIIEKIDLPNP